MAKHYRQNRKDREDERRGMERAERKSGSMAMPKDASEHMGDSTQLYHMGKKYYGPGYGHMANMPPYPDIKEYPKGYSGLDTDNYPDTIREIDRVAEDNSDEIKSRPSRSMY